MAARSGVSIRVSGNVNRKIDPELATVAFRIFQEALTNARRHSGAKRIFVVLKLEGSNMVTEVSDDGCGFGPETLPGVGSGSMRERAAIIGGELEISGRSGRGVSVRIRVPMPQG